MEILGHAGDVELKQKTLCVSKVSKAFICDITAKGIKLKLREHDEGMLIGWLRVIKVKLSKNV